MHRDGKPSLGSNTDNQKPQEQSDDECGKAKEQISSRVTKLEMPITPPDNGKTEEPKKHWIDYSKFGLEICGFIVLCVYAYFTIRIYCANQQAANAAHDTLVEIQKQTLLARQQTVGTLAAILQANVEFPGDGKLRWNLYNTQGRVNPTGVAPRRSARQNGRGHDGSGLHPVAR
jgi:hypothetical protein